MVGRYLITLITGMSVANCAPKPLVVHIEEQRCLFAKAVEDCKHQEFGTERVKIFERDLEVDYAKVKCSGEKEVKVITCQD